MWNFAALDTFPTINRQSYFQTGVAPKRQVLQRKPSCHRRSLKLLSAATCSVPHPHHLSPLSPPQSRMQFPNRSDLAMRSDTNKQGAQGELHAKLLSGTTVPGTPHHPPYLKSHVIPPRPHPPTAQKPRNINDPISKPETSSRELRAKLLSCTRFLGRPTRRPPRVLQGNKDVAAAPVGGGRARARTRTPDWRPPRGPGGQ